MAAVGPGAVRGLNHLTLAVTDLERSLGFYRDLLGMSVRARWSDGAYLEAGALWLCLSVDPKAGEAVRRDYTHIAFDVAPDDFPALSGTVAQAAPVWKDNRSEGLSLYVLDPDGHRVELHVGDLASRLDHYRRRMPPGMIID
ncbi:glutathione transferase [Azospirillum sp. B510]|uniref:VOC family protein n=1 Tax=Azospirillum sp. (strain B510) TaxID=137722 RepID=UPI0001C4C497|nr:VOC family protein [Azospirillum sp. B510]BAI72099.1 glutathione transferase [Azospirillum sp. B510]